MKPILSVIALGILACIDLLVPTQIRAAERPHVVMLIAEREYETDQSLTTFSKNHLADSYRVTVVRADPNDRDSLVGLEAIDSADVLLVSVRRRTLPPQQLNRIRKYVASGKPVLGIRTASHAFCLRKEDPPQGRADWRDWDPVVFGGHYTNHYGNGLKTSVRVNRDHESHPIVAGINVETTFPSGGSLYKVSPLAEGTRVLLTGSVPDHPAEPIAWTFVRADGGKSFYTSLGHVDDFSGPILSKLLKNAIAWSLVKE